MKRTEMVVKIFELISSNIKTKNVLFLSADVLSLVEKNGMLPPGRDLAPFVVYEWEPE